jgi:hypothetical protein
MVSRLSSTLALVVCLFLASGCEQGIGINPGPIDLSSATEFFDAIVDPDGSVIVQFTLPKTEYVQVTLLAESTEDPRRPVNVPLGMRLGRSTGTGCAEVVSGVHAPGLRAHLASVLDAGSYCVQLFDVGNLTEFVGGLIRVVHPAPLVVPQPNTLTSASNMTVGGSFTRTFEASTPGTVSITLTDLQPSVPVGLGIGIIYDATVGCRLAQVITTTAGPSPQFTLQADPGEYCVQVFDIGNFTQNTTFALRIQHP